MVHVLKSFSFRFPFRFKILGESCNVDKEDYSDFHSDILKLIPCKISSKMEPFGLRCNKNLIKFSLHKNWLLYTDLFSNVQFSPSIFCFKF